MSATFVYLDTETTGLDPDRHHIWEMAWAADDEEVRSCVVSHSLLHADPQALRLNGYLDRVSAEFPQRWREEDLRYDVLPGTTLVGANPAFDATFLRARWHEAPWKYRLLDIEAYAMPALGLDEPRGLAYIAERLGIEAPDHTAAGGDVHVLRECHRALRKTYLGGRA